MGDRQAQKQGCREVSQYVGTRCDQCGASKTEANHWIQLYKCLGSEVLIVGDVKAVKTVGEIIVPVDLCGPACATTYLTKVVTPKAGANTKEGDTHGTNGSDRKAAA